MAICAILAEIPILNLYYEHKSPGILNNLDLISHCISIEEENVKINNFVNQFMAEDYEKTLKKITNAKDKGYVYFDETFQLLNGNL